MPLQIRHLICFLSLLTILLAASAPGVATAQPPDTPPNSDAPIGLNVGKITNSEMLWFTNQIPRAEGWLTQCDDPCGFQWDTGEQDQLVIDSDGWIISFGNDPNRQFTHVALTLFAGASQIAPAGEWIVLYEGEATLDYGFDPFVTVVSRSPGRDVLQLTPASDTLLRIRLSNINPDNHLRNLRLIPPGGICDNNPFSYALTAAECSDTFQSFEQIYPTQRFHPLLLQALRPFRALRFMQFQGIPEDLTAKTWDQRSQLSDALWAKGWADGSPPPEVMFELSNTIQADAWVHIPYYGDDVYAQGLAQLALQQLDSNLNIYIEYANEIWNDAPPYAFYNQIIEQWAQARWPNDPTPAYGKRLNYAGMRSAQICDIWKQVWGAEAQRVRCIMPGGPWEFPATQTLGCPLYAAETGLPDCAGQMYALAIAPYFGGYINDFTNAQGGYFEQISPWTQEADGGLNRLFNELTTGQELQDQYNMNGAIAGAATIMAQNKVVADQYGLPLVAYEGGQHLTMYSLLGVTCNPYNTDPTCDAYRPIQDMYVAANRDPRMGSLYDTYLDAWRTEGGELFMHYDAISLANPNFGSWGALEYVGQPVDQAPKYQALLRFMANNPCWWADCTWQPPQASPGYGVYLPLIVK